MLHHRREHRSHLTEVCGSHWWGQLFWKQQWNRCRGSNVKAESLSAACARAACGSEEEGRGTPWKRGQIVSFSSSNKQKVQPLMSLRLLNGINNDPHLMMFSMQALWRKKALTTGVPAGTKGALQRKDRSARTLWKDWKSSSPWGRTVTRWQSSVRITRSRMIGLANRESCQKQQVNKWGQYRILRTKTPFYSAGHETYIPKRRICLFK